MSDREAPPLDWAQLMRLGLGVLGRSPDAFWAMTPVELTRALEGAGVIPVAGQSRGIERPILEALMSAYPDQPVDSQTEETR